MDYPYLCFGCMKEKGAGIICPNCGYANGSIPESDLHLPLGTVLQEKCILGRVLGQGGFGITYLAWDKILNIKLANKEYLPQQLAYRTDANTVVKIYKSSLAADFSYGLNKFLQEARTLARFNEHPNIVTVRDYFESNNTAYLVMNYHQGVTLQYYLDSKGGKIQVEQALKIFMPVLDALKEVNAVGILHRDISPDNLLIDKTGRVILIDFGAARQAMGDQSRSLSVIMKAGYSPEEQYRSKGKQGSWTDIYALAATLYRAITGIMPPESLDRLADDALVRPSKLGVEITSQQEETLLKALAVKADDRYKEVSEMQNELLPGKTDELQSIPERKEPIKAIEVEKMIRTQEESNLVNAKSDDYRNSQTDTFSIFISGATIVVLILIGLVAFNFYRIPSSEWHGGAYEGEMEEGIPHGYGEWSNEFGEKYLGQWLNGGKHGQGTYWFLNGNRYIGQWADNVQNGIGAYIYVDDTMIAGVWDNGNLLQPTYYIPEIDANILELRFFEWDGYSDDLDYRTYENIFQAERARYIVAELQLEYPREEFERTTTVLHIVFKSDGTVVKYNRGSPEFREWQITLSPETIGSVQYFVFGKDEPGFWKPDTYQVLIVADDQPLILESFTVY
jgi:serine/threonine protein kinase